jgi:hypothetical protein
MKKIILFSASFLFSIVLFAQKMEVGNNMFGIAIGPESYGFSPYVRASLERGMFEIGPGTLTLGAQLGLSQNFGISNTHLLVGLRSAWHYNFGNLKFKGSDKINAYAGGSIGISHYTNHVNGGTSWTNGSWTTPMVNAFLGASYFFQDNVAVFVEEEGGFPSSFTMIGLQLWF